jgi:hypothetical protein
MRSGFGRALARPSGRRWQSGEAGPPERHVDAVPFDEEEDESPFVGLLQVEAM